MTVKEWVRRIEGVNSVLITFKYHGKEIGKVEKKDGDDWFIENDDIPSEVRDKFVQKIELVYPGEYGFTQGVIDIHVSDYDE